MFFLHVAVGNPFFHAFTFQSFHFDFHYVPYRFHTLRSYFSFLYYFSVVCGIRFISCGRITIFRCLFSHLGLVSFHLVYRIYPFPLFILLILFYHNLLTVGNMCPLRSVNYYFGLFQTSNPTVDLWCSACRVIVLPLSVLHVATI